MGLFLLGDNNKDDYLVKAIHNEQGFRQIRKSLADQYLTENYIPKIEIVDVDHYGTRTLTLMYYGTGNRELSLQAKNVMKHIEDLWGFPVSLVDQDMKPYKIA